MIGKKIFLGIAAIVLLVQSSPAQETITTAVPFLLIAPNSRASGMGEGGSALADDAWAQFWNPGGLAFQRGSEIALSHANWLPQFNFNDLWIAHGIWKEYFESLDGTVSGGITYLNLGEFTRTLNDPTPLGTFKAYEFAVTGGYSTLISDNVGLGVNMKFIYSHLAPFGTDQEQGKGIATGVGFDVGVLYKPDIISIPFTDIELKRFMNIGVNLANIGPDIFYIDKKQSDPLPMNFRLGIAFNILDDPYNSITATADFNKLLIRTIKGSGASHDPFYKAIVTSWFDRPFNKEMAEITTGLGVEYWYGEPRLIALRAGWFYEDPNFGNRKFMTFGAGIRYDIYGFDFGYISTMEEQHPLGNTLRFSLLLMP